jgi:hypothetical protein
MFQKFFKNIACKHTESELDKLISKFSSRDPEIIFILHQGAKPGPGVWRLMMTDEYAEFFDRLCLIEKHDLDEESKIKIVIYTQDFIQLQRNSHEEITKFSFWFWKVIFNTMLYPKLENKARVLTNLIQSQSSQYINDFIRKAEEAMGQKAENTESLEECTLYHILPKYYK